MSNTDIIEEDNVEPPILDPIQTPPSSQSIDPPVSRTREEWLYILRKDGLQLKNCHDQNDELVLNAILNNPFAIKYAIEQKEEFCIIAMSRDPRTYNVLQNVSSFCAILNLVMNDAKIGEHQMNSKTKYTVEKERKPLSPSLSNLYSPDELSKLREQFSQEKLHEMSMLIDKILDHSDDSNSLSQTNSLSNSPERDF